MKFQQVNDTYKKCSYLGAIPKRRTGRIGGHNINDCRVLFLTHITTIYLVQFAYMIQYLIFLIGLLLCHQTLCAQIRLNPDTLETVSITPTFTATIGKYYLDSVEIDITKTYLNADNIVAINAIKSNEAKVFSSNRSAILIIRKIPTPLAALNQFAPKDAPYQFVINGQFIPDTTNIRIEVTAIDSITILRTAAASVIHDPMCPTVILKIKKQHTKLQTAQ